MIFYLQKAKKDTTGRPEKMTPEKLAQFKLFIVAGCTLKKACEQIEITPNTWRNYCKRHPDYLTKFAKWKNELESRAKVNIALKIIDEKDASTSAYYLEQQVKLKDQAARTALNRAKAKQAKLQVKLLEKQLERIDTTASKAKDSMAKLDTKTLEKLASLDEGVDFDAIN